jgi:hypothetical protein
MNEVAMKLSNEKAKRQGLKMCSLDDIMFPVENVPQTDFACNSDYSNDIFGYIPDKDNGIWFRPQPTHIKTRLNTCSDRYKLVSNAEVFMPVRELLNSKGIGFTETYMQKDNARFYGQYSIDANPYSINGNPNDKIYPMLRVQHSYNGLTRYVISFGYYRLVCTNGLTIPVKEMNKFNKSIGGKHTVSIIEAMGELKVLLNQFVEQSGTFLHNFDVLAQKEYTEVLQWENRVKEVMAATKISLGNNPENGWNYLKEIINRESMDFYGGVTNDFLIYNALNQFTNDNKLNTIVPEKRQEIDRNVLIHMLA